MLQHPCRTIFRTIALAATLALMALDYLFTIKLTGKKGSIHARADWLQRQTKRLLRVLAIKPVYHGEPPAHGVLVCNHLSYTDILVLAARHPLVFIAKAEVSGWPVFGMLSRFAGTLFVRREVRSDVVRLASQMPPIVDSGVVLTFFPEGTSTGGDRILPFHASLLAPASAHEWVITPAYLRYELDPCDGSVENDVAYWRDMVFGPHLLNLLGKREIRASVTYGQPEQAGKDRKALAHHLREEVSRLGGL
jgi:1-acyl-sn-glycerol-3-phosphate acyltransferase